MSQKQEDLIVVLDIGSANTRVLAADVNEGVLRYRGHGEVESVGMRKGLIAELGSAARHYNFNASSDARSIFRYHMHTLPDEVSGPIGTSTLFAAWNAAIYVAQIEDNRLQEVVRDGRYLEATDRVLKKHGGLWFNDETYVISRRRAPA